MVRCILIGKNQKGMRSDITMKDTENYEQLLERFYKRITQLKDKQKELEDAHLEYIKLE